MNRKIFLVIAMFSVFSVASDFCDDEQFCFYTREDLVHTKSYQGLKYVHAGAGTAILAWQAYKNYQENGFSTPSFESVFYGTAFYCTILPTSWLLKKLPPIGPNILQKYVGTNNKEMLGVMLYIQDFGIDLGLKCCVSTMGNKIADTFGSLPFASAEELKNIENCTIEIMDGYDGDAQEIIRQKILQAPNANYICRSYSTDEDHVMYFLNSIMDDFKSTEVWNKEYASIINRDIGDYRIYDYDRFHMPKFSKLRDGLPRLIDIVTSNLSKIEAKKLLQSVEETYFSIFHNGPDVFSPGHKYRFLILTFAAVRDNLSIDNLISNLEKLDNFISIYENLHGDSLHSLLSLLPLN